MKPSSLPWRGFAIRRSSRPWSGCSSPTRFLFGMLVIACWRVKGLWKILPLVPVLAMVVLFPVVTQLLTEDTRGFFAEVKYPDKTVIRHEYLTMEEANSFIKKAIETEKFYEFSMGGTGEIRFTSTWYLLGPVCGCCLMIAGFSQRRAASRSAA